MRPWYCRLFDPFNLQSLNEIVGEDKPIYKELREIVPFFKIWRQKATGLRILHASLGVSSVLFSLLTTTVLQFDGTYWNIYAKIFAFIAAVSIGLMTAFNVGTKSNDFTRAWRKLTAAIIRFNEGFINKEKVIDEYIRAERLIGDVTFDQSLTPSHDDGTTGKTDNENDGTGSNNTAEEQQEDPNKTPPAHNNTDSANKSKSEPGDPSL
jgi:hypothetical protein